MREERGLCTLYIVRHGESEANVNKITQGHTDSLLTARGEEQAKGLAQTFKDINFGAIYSSDLDRAKKTAEIIGLDRDIDVRTSPALREKFFGEFEGKKHKEYVAALKEEFEKFDNHLGAQERWEHKAHSSIESDKELLERFLAYVNEIVSNHMGETVLIVAHRYAIRMFLLHLGVGKHENLKDGALKTGGYAILESDGEGFVVKEVVSREE